MAMQGRAGQGFRQADAELKFGHHHGRYAYLFGGYRL